MNALISELAVISGFANSSFGENTRLDCFADLIIKECISACQTDQLSKTISVEELIKQRFELE